MDDCTLFSQFYTAFQCRDGNLDELFKYKNQPWPPALAQQSQTGGFLKEGKEHWKYSTGSVHTGAIKCFWSNLTISVLLYGDGKEKETHENQNQKLPQTKYSCYELIYMYSVVQERYKEQSKCVKASLDCTDLCNSGRHCNSNKYLFSMFIFNWWSTSQFSCFIVILDAKLL